MRRAVPLILILLAACARSEDAAVVAGSNDTEAVEQVRSPEQDDGDIAVGAWRETLQGDNTALEFGPEGAAPLFSLRCDARRSVFLQRHGALATGDLPVMLISIGSETRRLAVTSVSEPAPMLRASLSASDTLIGILSSATTPITVRIGDAPPLVLPPGPAIASFLGRCESGAAAPAPAEANTAAPADEPDASANASAPAPAQR